MTEMPGVIAQLSVLTFIITSMLDMSLIIVAAAAGTPFLPFRVSAGATPATLKV
jgi:hypothetical protein